MAGYWPPFFLASLWTSTPSRLINTPEKNLANIQLFKELKNCRGCNQEKCDTHVIWQAWNNVIGAIPKVNFSLSVLFGFVMRSQINQVEKVLQKKKTRKLATMHFC